MWKIYKYPLQTGPGMFEISMPAKFDVLSIQVQDGKPCLWAEVNTGYEVVQVVFSCAGTGHEKPRGQHIGTVQQGPYVWHYYQQTASK